MLKIETIDLVQISQSMLPGTVEDLIESRVKIVKYGQLNVYHANILVAVSIEMIITSKFD